MRGEHGDFDLPWSSIYEEAERSRPAAAGAAAHFK